jgi:sodium/potassium/calcium exchanger 6
VHHAKDKCAFIKANCPDEEAGLLSYLSLYYCDLQKAQPVAFVILALWLGLLFTTIGIAASDFFCINLSTIASILGMSESMAGVTFLAFGNGSPDVFSTFAAMSSHSGSLAVGELIGAAGFITAVVAGSMALVREFKVGKKTFVRDVGFFIVAASFSMIFLADGHLHLWECSAMIGFYVFYVVVVVVWHWYLGRRRLRREREAAARGHYLVTSNEEIEISENDEDDEDAPAGQGRYRDEEDFDALEGGLSPAYAGSHGHDSDDDRDQGMHLAAEMASSMRVTRPNGQRRNTITPIRPSLVGALEFRSVLSSLQKSRGSFARPIHLRRYSDDPTGGNAIGEYGGQDGHLGPFSDTASNIIIAPPEEQEENQEGSSTKRVRAVSMNDVVGNRAPDPAAFSVATIPNIGIVAATPTHPRNFNLALQPPQSPTISLSPPASGRSTRDPSPNPAREHRKRDSLAPPDDYFPRHLHAEPDNDSSRTPTRPRLEIPNSGSRDSSRSPSSPVLQFPAYTDSPMPMSAVSSRAPSLMLPENALTPESSYTQQGLDLDYQERVIKWWPYRFLPSPYVLLSTLFPTLCIWRDKSIWDKFVSVISAPSIFLLAITLPVVESENQDNQDDLQPSSVADERASLVRSRGESGPPLLPPDSPSLEAENEWIRYRRASRATSGSSGHPSPHMNGLTSHDAAHVAISVENHHHHSHPNPNSTKPDTPKRSDPHGPGEVNGFSSETPPAGDWNRWLVSVQIFTAPLFTVFIVWANTTPTLNRLVQLVLYSLLGSTVAFGVLVLTTTPTKPPKYRFVLCFLGFVVSISWISTIANEVVGVLKAFGVILGISDAILGLTIFAVGNSLGDLVADITVARLGYPVMALSACFGGPMLNILLGIGVSGLYMTLKEANHKHAKHPSDEIRYKPYKIEVSRTLMVSGATLIVTLLGLLIAVPLNKWVMSRRIGWGLISLWAVSTVINLGVEISGWGTITS